MELDTDKSRRLLELNRLLFERRGDEFVLSLAKYVGTERLPISESAVAAFASAAIAVTPEPDKS